MSLGILMLVISIGVNGQPGDANLQYANPLGNGRISIGFVTRYTYGPWGILPVTPNPPESSIFVLGDYYPTLSLGLSDRMTFSMALSFYRDVANNIDTTEGGMGEWDFTLKYSKPLKNGAYWAFIPEVYIYTTRIKSGSIREYTTGFDYGLTFAYSKISDKHSIHFNIGAFDRDNVKQGAGLNYGYVGGKFGKFFNKKAEGYLRFEYLPILTSVIYGDSSYGKWPLKVGGGLNFKMRDRYNLNFDLMIHMRDRGKVLKLSPFPAKNPSVEVSIGFNYEFYRGARPGRLSLSRGNRTIRGVVKDAETGTPLIADIILADAGIYLKSGADGHFVITDLPRGSYKLTVDAEGYVPGIIDINLDGSREASLEIALHPVKAVVRGNVMDPVTGKKLSGKVIISPDNLTVDAVNGEFEVELPYGMHVITVETEAGKATRIAVIKDNNPITMDFNVSGELTGASLTDELPSIYFAYNSSKIPSSEISKLDRVASFLKANPGLAVEVAGHTDSDGDFDYNANLSLKRANAVIDYLVQKGVSRDRLIAKGYSESRVADFNATPEGKQHNRRVEFIVLR